MQKKARKIADNAVINQSDLLINDIANKVLDAAKEGRYKETFEFSYPLLFKWEIIKNYLKEKGYQISVDMNDDIFRFSVMWDEWGLNDDTKWSKSISKGINWS